MRRATTAVLAALAAWSSAPAPRAAEPGDQIKLVGVEKLPNVPGKSITAIVVSYDPGGKSGRHHHAGSVFAYVLSGAIRSENSATGPAKVYQAARASSSRRAASTWSARTPAPPSRPACSPSSSPTTAPSSRRSTTDTDTT